MNYNRPQLLDKLAAAYVLGTMSAGARKRFSRVLADSMAAQRAVAEWQTRLVPLNQSIAPVSPPARLWQAIAVRTRPRPPVAAPGWLEKIAGSYAAWLKPAFAFSLGVVLAAGLIQQMPQLLHMEASSNVLAASYVGLLTDAAGAPVLAASSLRHGKILSVKILRPLHIPPGRVAQLWALPTDGAPVPIGVVPANEKATQLHLAAPAEKIFSKVPKLAVSYELAPMANAPSGDFVLSGHCIKIW
ncbi:MAG: hypothetical protein A3I66_05365 [Burkholderiales bacterium RIFCSPLOWO2_02_FULL_57_36]|nr:MAG: hypothetical protein A3I66_05365 [Burkholderiales bacterium RIFCSPLOWO2_02_FULL_57_36]